MDSKELEKYSSAISLSDMEIFVFPELMYSLVLANIMSPAIWEWRNLSTFKKIENKSPWRKLLRLRQFIMDEYDFNLDLNTWGLTDKDVEIERFKDFISPEQIAQSNALFGYHGDEYYFDIGIRKHFGLDSYEGSIIPYWKTETVEAMNAFRFKQGYDLGAGECVSLSALYAAAAFVVCNIPLEDIYMILTPLHSQNFIDIQEGVITNNRRVLTKGMWFNGTAITEKAQRALRNEEVTIVAHPTGYIHCFYDQATIDRSKYKKLTDQLNSYLKTDLDTTTFTSFLRAYHKYQKHFVFCHHHRGEDKFVNAEMLYQYEHGNGFKIGGDSLDKILCEVESEDFAPFKSEDRICIEQMIRFMKKTGIDIFTDQGKLLCQKYFQRYIDNNIEFIDDLISFCQIQPNMPSESKIYSPSTPINIASDMSREEIIEYLQSVRDQNKMADLAFYAYRDMSRCDWIPFLKASIERCPVSVDLAKDLSGPAEIYDWLKRMEAVSIYDGPRLAHPDEVVNYFRGDGIEKAITFANILKAKNPQKPIEIIIDKEMVVLNFDDSYEFSSNKKLKKKIKITQDYELSDI